MVFIQYPYTEIFRTTAVRIKIGHTINTEN